MDDYYRNCAIPKTRPKLLEKREAKAGLDAKDKAERKKCHQRSGGQCEVIIVTFRPENSAIYPKRCPRRASQNHHLMGGIGRRNRGKSLSHLHRIDVCDRDRCHSEITGHVLRPVNQTLGEDAASVRYERVR